MIFARKINKIPEFYMIFARTFHNNYPKNIFPELVPPYPPSPTPMLVKNELCKGH